MTEARPISVAETKRRFSDVLGAVRYHHERFIIERNGTPMAALVPMSDLDHQAPERRGFLAFVGAFSDAPEFADTLAEVVDSRETQPSRPAPRLAL